jgi:hypothetical protein
LKREDKKSKEETQREQSGVEENNEQHFGEVLKRIGMSALVVNDYTQAATFSPYNALPSCRGYPETKGSSLPVFLHGAPANAS